MGCAGIISLRGPLRSFDSDMLIRTAASFPGPWMRATARLLQVGVDAARGTLVLFLRLLSPFSPPPFPPFPLLVHVAG